MNKVVSKHHFSDNVVGLEIEAPRIAKARKAGHFGNVFLLLYLQQILTKAL